MARGTGRGSHDAAREGDADAKRIRRALEERLEGVAAPHVAKSILDTALARARFREVPTSSAQLAEFARGPLYAGMISTLGEDEALHVLQYVTVIVRAQEASEEITHVRAKPATTKPPIEGNQPSEPATCRPRMGEPLVVVMSSTDPHVGPELARILGPTATVLRAEDVMDLVEAVDGARERSPIVVLDGHAPAVHPSTFAAMMQPLASRVRVVLWGYDEDTATSLARIAPNAKDWTQVPGEVEPKDLALLLGLT